MTKPTYWLVVWAGNERISDRKHTRREACIDCFGIYTPEMKTSSFTRIWRNLTLKEQGVVRANLVGEVPTDVELI